MGAEFIIRHVFSGIPSHARGGDPRPQRRMPRSHLRTSLLMERAVHSTARVWRVPHFFHLSQARFPVQSIGEGEYHVYAFTFR